MSLKNLPLNKIHKGLFYLLVLLLPTQLTKHFWPSFAFISGIRIDYLAPTIYLTDILVIVTITAWTIATITSRTRTGKAVNIKRLLYFATGRQSSIAISLFLSGYIILNISLAHNPWVSLLKWLKIGEMGLLALYVIRTKPNLRITYYVLLVTGFASIILAWLQFMKGGSIGGLLYWIGERTFTLGTPGIARQSFFGQEYLRPYATFPHPNVLAGFLTATLPFILRGPLIRGPLLKLGLLTVWLATIFITGSQVALLVSVGIIFLFLNHRNKVILTILILLVLLIFNFQFSIFNQTSILNFQTQNTSITRRWELIKAAIDMFKTSPITGIGLNNFVVRLPEFYRLNEPAFFLQPVHNIYLLTLVEGGLVGLILLLWLLSKLYGVSISNFKFQISKQISNPKSQIPNTFKIWLLSIGAYLGQLLACRRGREIRSIRNLWMLSLTSMLLLGFFDHYLFTLQQGLLLFVIILSFAFLATKKP